MKIAITSDTHFGDPMSTLVSRGHDGNKLIGTQYPAFRDAIKRELGDEIDYLILAGDVLDFSIASYRDAYDISQFFFNQLKIDNVAKEIIYLPGNHDFDIWHTVEYQVNVINKFEQKKLPTKFRMSVPGIIDDRTDSENPGFTLVGVSKKDNAEDGPRYAGLFLDNITNPSTYFNFVYPNLYIVTDQESILVTHGQYLELYWSMLGKWAARILDDDLGIGTILTLKDMVALNFSLCQFACSGIGQSGPLTGVILNLEHEIKEKNFGSLERYLDRIDGQVDSLLKQNWYTRLLEPGEELSYRLLKKLLFHSLSQIKTNPRDEDFIRRKEVQERFLNFFRASVNEIKEIKTTYGHDLPVPDKMIYGHTHRPVSWEVKKATEILVPITKKRVRIYNTGGWLNKRNARGRLMFCGAEVFLYQTGKGFSSVSVK